MSDPPASRGEDLRAPERGTALEGLAGVEGPSFPRTAKAGATVLLVALVALAVQNRGAFAETDLGWGGFAFVGALAVALLAGWWSILTSRTSFDGTTIRQTGLLTKQVALADIRRLKLVHVPGLEAVLIPRLVVRGTGFTVMTFQAADPAVLAAFRRLAYG
jgi:hypothetical protein